MSARTGAAIPLENYKENWLKQELYGRANHT
jgi:hypothetical protein